MSHFVVLVVGDDVEKQLQPFHEFECTGHDDEYVVEVDKTAEIQARIDKEGESIEDAVEYHLGDNKIVTDESEIDREGRHKYGYAIVRDGALIKAVDRTNPNAKWDWWVVGGRWTGYFTTKGPGGTLGERGLSCGPKDDAEYERQRTGNKADSCKWGDVDLEAMKSVEREEANTAFSQWEECFTKHGRPRSWEEVLEAHGEAQIEAARTEYWGQPAIQEMRKRNGWCNPDLYGFDREKYVEERVRQSVIPFAILKDGVWHEKGRMGWFASVSGENVNWVDHAEALLASIDPDTTVTAVDCHI